MSVNSELQLLELDSSVTLVELDLRPVNEGIIRLTNQSDYGDSVYHDTFAYIPCPLTMTGFRHNSQGTVARPTLTFSLIDLALRDIALGEFESEDQINAIENRLHGQTVYRKQILARHLDNGSTPNPLGVYRHDQYLIDSLSISGDVVEVSLVSPNDQQGRNIPAENYNADTCRFNYRGSRCKYAGTDYFNSTNTPTIDETQDQCSKSLKGCRLRGNEANFGGFPSLGRS